MRNKLKELISRGRVIAKDFLVNMGKDRDTFFVCQVSDKNMEALKFLNVQGKKKVFLGFLSEDIPQGLSPQEVSARLSGLLARLGYKNDPVVFSLPRNKVVSRHLKVPSQAPDEIAKIVSFQAPKYFPYHQEEMVTGYQVISTEKDGFSTASLIIAHKDIISWYIALFRELKPRSLFITVSSYGLVSLARYIYPQAKDIAILIDIGSSWSELVIVLEDKALFSHYFKADQSSPLWKDIYLDEINKSRSIYFREVSIEAPARIILTGINNLCRQLALHLTKETALPVEILTLDGINIDKELQERILGLNISLANVIGLGVGSTQDSLNLLPQDIKAEMKARVKYTEALRTGVFILAIALILLIAGAKNIANKENRLKRLNAELGKISAETKSIRYMEKKLQFAAKATGRKASGVEMLYEVYRAIPSGVSLVDLNYEAGKRIALRGQAPELDSVFAFVSALEGSPRVFKAFNIKMRHAVKRKAGSGDIVGFEIECLPK